MNSVLSAGLFRGTQNYAPCKYTDNSSFEVSNTKVNQVSSNNRSRQKTSFHWLDSTLRKFQEVVPMFQRSAATKNHVCKFGWNFRMPVGSPQLKAQPVILQDTRKGCTTITLDTHTNLLQHFPSYLLSTYILIALHRLIMCKCSFGSFCAQTMSGLTRRQPQDNTKEKQWRTGSGSSRKNGSLKSLRERMGSRETRMEAHAKIPKQHAPFQQGANHLQSKLRCLCQVLFTWMPISE